MFANMLIVCFVLLFVLNFVQQAEQVNTCEPDDFPCDNGSCISKLKWCDGREDCDDDSDENYCHLKSALRKNPNRCNETIFFLCDDGQCIPAVGRCDGFSSCFDNSDEENCETAFSSSTSTTQSSRSELSMPLSRNDSKVFGNSYDLQSSMQADHVPPTDTETTNKNVTYSVVLSNTLENSSNAVLEMDHKTLQANVSLNVDNVSKNVTNEGLGSFVLVNRRQPLEFRNISGGMLNISRNEQNATTINNSESLSSVSLKKNSTLELDKGNMTKMVLEIFNDQNGSRHAISHAKLQSSHETMNKEFDLYEGYVKLQTRDFRKSKEKALHWIVENQNKDYGWGEETARALITLWLASYSSEKHEMAALASKQLHLKLFTLMSRNETHKIPLGELALYINALSASCDNPKNFHGNDLIDILRHRTNAAQMSSQFVTPFVYLVLCLNDKLSDADVRKVRDMLYDSNITKTDMEAMISLTATCISRTHQFSNIGIEQIAVRKLYNKITTGGLPRTVYELSLLTQALNEAKINQNLWNRSEAMRRITGLQEDGGSFGDILSTYYAVPTLCGKSFLWIGKNCHRNDDGFTPVEVLKNGKNEKMSVHYFLLFGNPVEMSQSLMIKVQKNTSFMDIMRIAATVNPAYRFKYDENDGKLAVYSIGGIANDVERGLHWVPYTSRNSTKELFLFEGDIRNFIPLPGDNIAFWREPML